MVHDQIQIVRIQMLTTALIAVGAVFISMGVSNINFVESSTFSLLQFEYTLLTEPEIHSELIDSLDALRDTFQYRMDQAWIFFISGFIFLLSGILVGSFGLSRFM